MTPIDAPFGFQGPTRDRLQFADAYAEMNVMYAARRSNAMRPGGTGGVRRAYACTGFSGSNQRAARVLNFLAAPFGSQEALLIDDGVEGADYTFDQRGNPVPTQHGPADSTCVEWNLVMQHLPVLYDAIYPDFARTAQTDEQMLPSNPIQNPTLGYYSATNIKQGATLDQAFNDGVADVVTGRRPLSDFDQLVKDWLNNGGEQMRTEYQNSMSTLSDR
jgi:hypothetical protein